MSWRSYSSNEENFAYGFIQDYQQSNPLTAGYKFRYFCANEIKEAIEGHVEAGPRAATRRQAPWREERSEKQGSEPGRHAEDVQATWRFFRLSS